MAARDPGRPSRVSPGHRASPALRFFPVFVLAIAAVVAFTVKRRERRLWDGRRISGGRKALVLNLFDR